MKKNNPLVIGTFILTLTGLISRVIGFFYRIFLSQLFGEEGMGIYQLIAPILALSFSFTVAGIQTAISKYVATETTTHDYKSSLRILLVGFLLSFSLSIFCCIFVFQNATWLATSVLLEPRCDSLLRIIALSVPFSAIHSIANGYFYGIKKTTIPAITQLVEQLVRVASVFIIYQIACKTNRTPNIGVAVIGLVIGEFASMLISLSAIYLRFAKLLSLKERFATSIQSIHQTGKIYLYKKLLHNMLVLSVPLSANRIIINLLQSVEAIYIPSRLRMFGLDTKGSLSIYGVLMGMALPLILFPSAITNSVSVLLLPIVSEAESNNNYRMIKKAVHKSIKYCILLGITCTSGFLLMGNFIGELLFQSQIAGSFIQTLSFICPFLYLTSTLSSILNGLGKTALTFCFSIIGLSIRLLFVFCAIPVYGIKGYMWGLLISQLVITLLTIFAVERYVKKQAR